MPLKSSDNAGGKLNGILCKKRIDPTVSETECKRTRYDLDH